jgi:S-adenosylmethionine:tRNA ribosyltransferase-isomerase
LDSGNLQIETIGQDDNGIRTLTLSLPINHPALRSYKLTPLPPYIKQNESLSAEYQTVYAKPLGSKAAPTAGLHFTDKQLKALSQSHNVVYITLHVSLGTFAGVQAEDILTHKMHSEEFFISATAAKALNKASHVTAVGTTSARVLESAGLGFKEASGTTDIFIIPGYKFKVVDSLVTNFHLPKSTLLMLVSAFIGSVDELHRLYKHAINEQYRFYSFGDAMLIL